MKNLDSEEGWLSAPTPPDRVEVVKTRLEAFSVTDPNDIHSVLGVLDWFGLFHDPVPRPGDPNATTRQIRKRAKKAGRSSESEKAASELYQIRRGGRIIPRFAKPEDRKRSQNGRRSEPEVTSAFQILDRFLSERNPQLSRNAREECIADVYRAARNIPSQPHECKNLWCKLRGCPRRRMIEAVRAQLKQASPLDDFDYQWTLGREPGGWEPYMVFPRKGVSVTGEDVITSMEAARNTGWKVLRVDGDRVSFECQWCGRVWAYTFNPKKPPPRKWNTCPNGCQKA